MKYMNDNDKLEAVKLVEDMVAHGYKLMQYKSAEELVEYYDWPEFTLASWKENHDRFMQRKA